MAITTITATNRGPLRPPRAGQPISARYLAQEYRAARSASTPLGEPSWQRFKSPSGGIAAATSDSGGIIPAVGLCRRMIWTGSRWVEDADAPQEQVYNSFEDHTVPASEIVEARWVAGHWEAVVWNCPAPP